MPSVINQVIIPAWTLIGSAGRFSSQPVDVSGTQSISVNVSITGTNPAIKRTIYFGTAPNGGFAPAQIDAFDTTNHLFTSLPTHGPQMFVAVENRGPTDTNCQGWIYAVRLVP